MPAHTAYSLFELNIQSAKECETLYSAIDPLMPRSRKKSWLLRSMVVFSISAMDAYFHDKIRYRVRRFSNRDWDDYPAQLKKFKVPLKDLEKWDKAERKGNVIRNWLKEIRKVTARQADPAGLPDA